MQKYIACLLLLFTIHDTYSSQAQQDPLMTMVISDEHNDRTVSCKIYPSGNNQAQVFIEDTVPGMHHGGIHRLVAAAAQVTRDMTQQRQVMQPTNQRLCHDLLERSQHDQSQSEVARRKSCGDALFRTPSMNVFRREHTDMVTIPMPQQLQAQQQATTLVLPPITATARPQPSKKANPEQLRGHLQNPNVHALTVFDYNRRENGDIKLHYHALTEKLKERFVILQDPRQKDKLVQHFVSALLLVQGLAPVQAASKSQQQRHAFLQQHLSAETRLALFSLTQHDIFTTTGNRLRPI